MVKNYVSLNFPPKVLPTFGIIIKKKRIEAYIYFISIFIISIKFHFSPYFDIVYIPEFFINVSKSYTSLTIRLQRFSVK